jgi:hypothetical protein
MFRKLAPFLKREEMKMQKSTLLFSLLFLLAMLAGCVPSPERLITPSPVVTSPPLRSLTPTETMLPSITASATSTITPSSTPTFIPTLPTSTPSIIPTLPADDARQRLLDLLANNGACEIPCVWGITPGKSSYLEGRSILMPLMGIAEVADFTPKYHGDVITPLYIEDNSRLNTSVVDRLNTTVDYLYGNDGIVSHIHFEALEEEVTYDSNGNWTTKRPIVDSATFEKRVAYYSLAHVLTEQGMPASVMIRFTGERLYHEYAGGLNIALLYPDQGIWVNYEIPMENLGATKRGCPNGMAHVELELYPPGNHSSFYSQLDKTDWGTIKDSYKPIEEVTGMSVEKFYEIFRNPTANQCLETAANIWPTPIR